MIHDLIGCEPAPSLLDSVHISGINLSKGSSAAVNVWDSILNHWNTDPDSALFCLRNISWEIGPQ